MRFRRKRESGSLQINGTLIHVQADSASTIKVQPVRFIARQVRVRRVSWNAIALVQPLQKVSILAALRAEGPVGRIGRLAAERAGISFGWSGHVLPIWRGRDWGTRPLHRPCGAPAR